METILGIFSESFWWVAPILVTLTTGLTGLINQGFKIQHGWLKQLISWVLGAGLSVGAWALKVITFGNPVWLGVVCLCVVVGLASNGIYDISVIRNWINTWFVKSVVKDGTYSAPTISEENTGANISKKTVSADDSKKGTEWITVTATTEGVSKEKTHDESTISEKNVDTNNNNKTGWITVTATTEGVSKENK